MPKYAINMLFGNTEPTWRTVVTVLLQADNEQCNGKCLQRNATNH